MNIYLTIICEKNKNEWSSFVYSMNRNHKHQFGAGLVKYLRLVLSGT